MLANVFLHEGSSLRKHSTHNMRDTLGPIFWLTTNSFKKTVWQGLYFTRRHVPLIDVCCGPIFPVTKGASEMAFQERREWRGWAFMLGSWIVFGLASYWWISWKEDHPTLPHVVQPTRTRCDFRSIDEYGASEVGHLSGVILYAGSVEYMCGSYGPKYQPTQTQKTHCDFYTVDGDTPAYRVGELSGVTVYAGGVEYICK